MKKKVARAGWWVRNMPALTVRNVTKHQANSYNIYSEDLLQAYSRSMLATSVSVSSYELCLADSFSHVLLMSSSLTPTTFMLLCSSLQGDEHNGHLQWRLSLHIMPGFGSLYPLPPATSTTLHLHICSRKYFTTPSKKSLSTHTLVFPGF
jgi:hypothetical protein